MSAHPTADKSTRRPPQLEAIEKLVGAASLETATKNLAEIDLYKEWLPVGTHVYVTSLPGMPHQHGVSIAARLARARLKPVPHVAARRLADEQSARDFLARLSGEAGVDEVLVIAGDMERPTGPYKSAADLLESGLLQEHGIKVVGVAGYPEGHPKISDAELMRALMRKIAIGQRAGLDLQIVSQFCFESRTIMDWLKKLNVAGVDLPVHVGLAGPARVRTLLNYGRNCGVGASLRAMRGYGVSLTRLIAQAGPDEIVFQLAEAYTAGKLPTLAGLHFFSFGGVEKTASWMNTAAGRHV